MGLTVTQLAFAFGGSNPSLPTKKGVCQNPLVPALDAGPQKSKPYQSDVYMAGFNAIPHQAREQDSFDTPPFCFRFFRILSRNSFSFSVMI